jgi:hypothetical protein
MPHPSKRARKARRAKQNSVQQRALEIQNQNAKIIRYALEKDAHAARLARLLATVVALHGEQGTMKLPLEKINKLPGNARLQELVDRDTGDVTLMTVVDDDGVEQLTGSEEPLIIQPEAPKIILPDEPQVNVIRPKLEIVR